ncbi:hypothetical protein [Treponema pedis]|uniref:Uncharacterized protein n=1 Tax=Treponema pedis TaxID=409322 RepID=A0A7S6WMG6_9SPIR|nr:hypothetical protein [Treponema pedis]QOW59679.1 hypothetical protein IFE08_07265 [Treponema pedis]
MKLVILIFFFFFSFLFALFLYGIIAAFFLHKEFLKEKTTLLKREPEQYRKELIETVSKIMNKGLLKHFVIIGIKGITAYFKKVL